MFLLLSFNQGAVFADTNTPTPSPTVTGTLASTPVNSMLEISNPYWHSNPVNQNYVANLVNDFWVSQPTGSFQDLYINYRRSGTNLSYGASSNGVGVRVFFPVRQQSGAQRPLYAVVQYRASHPNVKYEITGCCGGRTWTWRANSFSPPYIGEGMWQGWINIPNSASYQNTSFWIGYSSGAIPLNANWWIEMTIHLSDGPVTNPYTPTPTPTSTSTLTPTPTNSYVYDRNNAVAYANTWAHDRNGDFPNFGSECDSCEDCTNYASQTLYSGGYPLRPGATWDYDSDFVWWYRMNFPPYNSKTWSLAGSFNSYFAQYTDEFDVNPPASLEGGDFMILDTNDDLKPDHIRVVVGNGETSTNERDYIGWGYDGNTCWEIINPTPTSVSTLLINQHCPDRWHVAWDYNIDPNEMNIWYIHVIP